MVRPVSVRRRLSRIYITKYILRWSACFVPSSWVGHGLYFTSQKCQKDGQMYDCRRQHHTANFRPVNSRADHIARNNATSWAIYRVWSQASNLLMFCARNVRTKLVILSDLKRSWSSRTPFYHAGTQHWSLKDQPQYHREAYGQRGCRRQYYSHGK